MEGSKGIKPRSRRTRLSLATIAVFLLAGGTLTVADWPIGNKDSSIDMDALYSDGTANFLSPMEPDRGQPVNVLLRTRKGNVANAFLQTADATFPMSYYQTDALFDYYRAQIPGSDRPIQYWFRVEGKDGKTMFYARTGASRSAPDNASAFWLYPGFKTPDWSKGAILYQIFVDRFYNGDPRNDVVTNEVLYDGKPVIRIENWDQPPDSTSDGQGGNRTREFYGGDLQGVIDKLPYLQQLGVEGIYLNPIFVAPSNHKYDTQDYDAVDPHFGKIVHDGGYKVRTTDPANLAASNELLQTLVAKAHALGIRVILDGVFNHTGMFHRWMDAEHLYPDMPPYGPGAYESKTSPFHDYYQFAEDTWPNNDSYESWNGFPTLPKINYEQAPQAVQYIYGVAQKWVSPPYSADGWRLDAALDVGHSHDFNLAFWKGFRDAVKKANPDAYIVAEMYEDPSEYLMGQQWDSVMNYTAFFDSVSYLFTGLDGQSHSQKEERKGNVAAFVQELQQTMAQLPYNALYSAMNQLDNHDNSRFLTRTNGLTGDTESRGAAQASQGTDLGILRQAALLQFTWPGDPTIYYGDEAGVTGWTDPDSRRTYPWGHENQQLLAYYRTLGSLHKSISALKDGSFKHLLVDAGQKVYAFGRWDASSKAATLLNFDGVSHTVEVPVWQLGAQDGNVWQVKLRSDDIDAKQTIQTIRVQHGVIKLELPGHTGMLVVSNQGTTIPKP